MLAEAIGAGLLPCHAIYMRHGVTCVFVSVWKEATDELAGAWAAAGRLLGRGSGWGACMHSTLAVGDRTSVEG